MKCSKGNFALVIMMAFFILTLPLFSGSGVITPRGFGVGIEQPLQRVVIAFNGEEEIIVLDQFLKGDKGMRGLRFMPLPSEPEFSSLEESIFPEVLSFAKNIGIKFKLLQRRS